MPELAVDKHRHVSPGDEDVRTTTGHPGKWRIDPIAQTPGRTATSSTQLWSDVPWAASTSGHRPNKRQGNLLIPPLMDQVLPDHLCSFRPGSYHHFPAPVPPGFDPRRGHQRPSLVAVIYGGRGPTNESRKGILTVRGRSEL
jgi:hypothetical protein